MRKVYNKLVRDKMIDIYRHDVENKISASGYSVRYLLPAETLAELKHKLREEMEEVFAVYEKTDRTELKEELADVLEVIEAILYHTGSTLADVSQIRENKKQKRGGFETGLYLESIDYFDEEK